MLDFALRPSLLVAEPRMFDARLPERYWSKVMPVPWCGCWLWVGGCKDSGHGVFWLDSMSRQAHRVAYEALIGDIDDGLELDHLCRVRCCVYPLHLEPVTKYVNTMRGDGPSALAARQLTCVRGHPLSPENIQPGARDGRRPCRICASARGLESRARRAQGK